MQMMLLRTKKFTGNGEVTAMWSMLPAPLLVKVIGTLSRTAFPFGQKRQDRRCILQVELQQEMGEGTAAGRNLQGCLGRNVRVDLIRQKQNGIEPLQVTQPENAACRHEAEH